MGGGGWVVERGGGRDGVARFFKFLWGRGYWELCRWGLDMLRFNRPGYLRKKISFVRYCGSGHARLGPGEAIKSCWEGLFGWLVGFPSNGYQNCSGGHTVKIYDGRHCQNSGQRGCVFQRWGLGVEFWNKNFCNFPRYWIVPLNLLENHLSPNLRQRIFNSIWLKSYHRVE